MKFKWRRKLNYAENSIVLICLRNEHSETMMTFVELLGRLQTPESTLQLLHEFGVVPDQKECECGGTMLPRLRRRGKRRGADDTRTGLSMSFAAKSVESGGGCL